VKGKDIPTTNSKSKILNPLKQPHPDYMLRNIKPKQAGRPQYNKHNHREKKDFGMV